MAEDGKNGTDEFDPKELSPQAREYIRRQVQSESDAKTQAAKEKLQREAAQASRMAAEKQEEDELQQMAEDGDFERLGQKVAQRLSTRSIEAGAVKQTSDVIEQQVVDEFTETLGAEAVERIRGEVAEAGTGHAGFAKALAAATAEKTRQTDLQAEVEAVLVRKGLLTREEITGADEVGAAGGGTKPTTREEIEAAYVRGEVSTEVYEEAQKNR